MKTYHHGFEGPGGKRINRKFGKNSIAKKIQRYVNSLSDEQIWRIIDESASTKKQASQQHFYTNTHSAQMEVQAKLEIAPTTDLHEKKADEIGKKISNNENAADLIKNHPEAEVSRQTSLQDDKKAVPELTTDFQNQLQSTKGGGQHLDVNTKTSMEQNMGTDLSGVKIHTDAKANELSENINAKAFTHGQDVYFNKGNYNPESKEGKELLGHELAHTVQQQGGVTRKVQRAIKFEIQTGNYVWQKDEAGNFTHLGRKFGEFGATERGELPAFITTGKHGRKALKKGDFEYEEVKGERAMEYDDLETIKSGIDFSKGAQHIITKVILNKDILTSGLPPKKGDLKTKEKINKADNSAQYPPGSYNPDVYQFIYYLESTEDDAPKRLEFHQEGPQEIFVPGFGNFMRKKKVMGKGINEDLPAQFIKIYRFKKPVSIESLIGNAVKEDELELVQQINNASTMALGTYNKNTFEFRYFNHGITAFTDDNLLQIHLNTERVFEKQHVKLMKVGRKPITQIDEAKEAQYVKVWKVTEDINGIISYFDPIQSKEVMVKIEEVKSMEKDNSNKEKYPDAKYNPGTYEMIYYNSSDFVGDTLSTTAKQMDVHLNDGRLKNGHVKFMKKRISEGNIVTVNNKQVDVGEEQTAMELQSESHGFIEFETPRWFSELEELKLRVQDAVDMADQLNTGILYTPTQTEKTQMENIKNNDDRQPPKGEPLGELREWPASLITPEVAKKLGGKKLYVEIADRGWDAFFQVSESISLSQFSSLIKDYENEPYPYPEVISNSSEHAKNILATAKGKSEFKDKDDSLFENLKGFLQLVTAYIIWGQYYNLPAGNKNIFKVMARNDFGEMHNFLLSADEKKLFSTIVSSPKIPTENILLSTDLQNRINSIRTGSDIQLTSSTRMYLDVTVSTTINPTIHNWLMGITTNKDLLSGSLQSVSDAIGGKKLNTKTDSKDYMQAMFEKRRGLEMVGKDKWVQHAEDMFNLAMSRMADTPDNPTTPSINESSKTGLKDN